MKKPTILCILDGYGIRHEKMGNAIMVAHKPNIDRFFRENAYTEIAASGMDVGLPTGQMGNSEVGHLNIGAGRIVYQSLTLINKAITDGEFFENTAYLAALAHAKKHHSKVHIMGLVSDGGVHSHYEHFQAMLDLCKRQELEKVYLHAFMDGRDVDPQSGVKYIDILVQHMNEIGVGKLATISGRYYAMDRDKNLDRVDRAYQVMVQHQGPSFDSYQDFFQYEYQVELPQLKMDPSDEFIVPHFNKNAPDSKIESNDAIIFMNFRPDRAIELSTIFTNPLFYAHPPLVAGVPAFKAYTPEPILNNIFHVSTMKYAESVKSHIAFRLPTLENVLGVYLANNKKTQLRIAETEKYAHVTFFFDGTVNYDGIEKPELLGCRRVLVPSPKVKTYDLQPEMSAFPLTDALIKELDKFDLDVVIINFANCDMVGHTAVEKAVIKAVETVDTCLGRIIEWVNIHGGNLLVTADHGNAEEIMTADHHPLTAHTTNLVPFCINDPRLKLRSGGRLGDIAPTILELIGLKKPIEMSESSLIIKEEE